MPDPTTIAAGSWTWVDTPDPANPILAVRVKTQLITVDTFDDAGNQLTTGNMPRRETPLGITPYVAPTAFSAIAPEFGLDHINSIGVKNWLFIGSRIGPEITELFFYKNQTAAQMLVPYDVETKTGNKFWHEVVLKVWPEIDESFPLSTNKAKPDGTLGIVTAPTVRIRALVIPDTEEGTEFITRKYLSATRPNIPAPSCPQSDTFVVFAGQGQREFNRVLHDDLEFGDTPSGSLFNANGTTEAVGGVVPLQKFPASYPFIGRRPYVQSDDPVRNEYGLWERIEVEVVPPKTNRTKVT